MKLVAPLLALLVAACGAAPSEAPAELPPSVDAAPAADATPSPEAGPDGAAPADGGREGSSATPDAGGPDGAATDAGGEGGDAAGEGSTTGPDAGPHTDGAAGDGGADAAPPDAGLRCTAPVTTCETAARADAAIRATFAGRGCDPGEEPRCGGVRQDGITTTYPLACRDGAWGLAWCGTVPCHECSRGCAAGALCDP